MVLVGCMVTGRVVVRAGPGAVQQFQPGMLFEVRGDLAGVANAVVIADHHDHRGPRERPEHLVQQGDESPPRSGGPAGTPTPRCSPRPPQHGDLAVRAWSEDPRAQAAQIELGTLLEQVTAGRQSESGATVAQLLDQYVQVAEWDVSTRAGFDGYIRRTIKPALRNMQVRKVRGLVLDMFYARLKKCGDRACNGRPFTEHRNVPMLKADPADRLPELCALQDPRMSTIQYAFSVLADEGVLVVRQERTAVVVGDPPGRGGRAGPTTASCPDAGRMHASR